jgi:hypothetical protein
MDSLVYEPLVGPRQFADRMKELHLGVYRSAEQHFDATMRCLYRAPPGYVVVDPQIVHDGSAWHLFYVTGKLEYADAWIDAIRRLDFAGARKIPYEEGDGHAMGPSLDRLAYHSTILTQPRGDYGWGLQGDSAIVRHQDHWVNLYSARGPGGTSLCLARSRDLVSWEEEPGNPMLWPPAWAMRPGKYGAAYIVGVADQYLVYVQCITREGLGAVQLLSTRDFATFVDHGPVFQMPLQLRGTMSVESPCVVERDGIWHLFVTSGPGTWHAVSDRPDRFHARPAAQQFVTTLGTYCMGPYHACRVFRAPDDRWYIVATRKEEQRRLNRESGEHTFRGSAQDEAALLQGMFLGRIEWDGDRPVVKRIREDEALP